MSSSANEPPVDRPPVTADVAPPGGVDAAGGAAPAETVEGVRQTRIGALRPPTDSLRAYTMLFALVLIWLVFHWMSVTEESPYGLFLTAENLTNLLKQMTVTGVLAVGMLMVIVAGQIDLSVGSVVGLAGAAAAMSQDWGLVQSLAAATRRRRHRALQEAASPTQLPAFIVNARGLLAGGDGSAPSRVEDDPAPDPSSSKWARPSGATIGYALAALAVAPSRDAPAATRRAGATPRPSGAGLRPRASSSVVVSSPSSPT